MYVGEPQDDEGIRSIALRLLIHYIGDIHQPFHTYEGYSSKFKKGDNGGNSNPNELINTTGLATFASQPMIHGVWDSVIGMHQNPYKHFKPFSEQEWTNQEKVVEEIR